ncbi:MAG: YihY/virulence factor BrkB family protein [Pirellulaceae bacterium]
MSFLKDAVTDFIEDDCLQLAAALAFYTLLSLTPLLVLVISIASLFVSPSDIQGEVASVARSVMGPKGGEQLKAMMSAGSIPGESIIARIISVIVLIFGATGVLVQLQASLNRIWEVKAAPNRSGLMNFVIKRILSFAMILAVAFILLVSLIMTAAVRALADRFSGLLGSGAAQFVVGESVTALTVILLFGTMFKLLPDAKIAWKDVWFGAVVTAILFTVGKFLIGLYLGSQHLGSTYGAASSLVLVLLWTYYSALIFFFGTELTQIWARHHGRSIEPTEGAVRASRHKEATSAEPQTA